MLSWTGCTDVEVRVVEDQHVVQVAAERLTMNTLAAISRGLPSANLARVQVSTPVGAIDKWTLDLEGFRAFSNSSDELEKQALLLLALCSLPCGGPPRTVIVSAPRKR